MNSSQKVIQRIKELGFPEAETYFGRTRSALKQWENNPDRVPAWAVDKIKEDEGPIVGQTSEAPVLPVSGDVMGRLANLEGRMAVVEFKLQTPTTTSVVPPQKQPNWTSPHNFNK